MLKNWNVAPYYDDFSESKNFYKIPALPGVALQARELSQVQSILQNQISRIGDNLFKNGAMVKPGQITLDLKYNYVKITSLVTDGQTLIDPALNEGSKIVLLGQTTGVKAQVLQYVPAQGADPITLYVKYLNSGTDGNTKTFTTEEGLALASAPASRIANVSAGETSVGLGCSASIGEGVYYIEQYFVRVSSQTLVLDKYTNSPSYKIGLNILGEIVTPEDDPSLNDNAQGSSNFAAPGAHRYKVTLVLEKKDLESSDDETFVEILRVNNGVVQYLVNNTQYNIIADTMARRTYDESGNYTVRPFHLNIREHLKDGSNNGVYTSQEGGDASKLAVGLEPGKAYVLGYERETLDTTYVTVDKARDYAAFNNSLTNAFIGNYFLINRVYTLPFIENFGTIDLYDAIISENGSSSGNKIGTARIRSIAFDSGTIANGAITAPYPVYKLYVFDIQLNAGKTIDDVYSVYQNGSPQAFTANVLSKITLRNVTGTFVANDTVTAGDYSETVVGWDANSNTLVLQPSNTDLISSGFKLINGINTGTVVTRTRIFDPSHSALVFKLPQSNVKTVRDIDSLNDTTYSVRSVFSGTYTGTTISISLSGLPNCQFATVNSSNIVVCNGATILDPNSLTYDQSNPLVLTISGVPDGTNAPYRILATVVKTVGVEKTKTLVQTTISQALVEGTLPTTISLGKCDIQKLDSVIEVTTGLNITSRYILDNGQRDAHYGVGSISLINGQPNSTDSNGVLVTFKYYTHGSGDYFSVDSYRSEDATWYEDIPKFTSANGTTYALRDCLDFRPKLDETSGGSLTFTSNPVLLTPNSDIRCDFAYYLGRIDKVYMDYRGNFQIVKGSSSISPLPPADPIDGMVLYVLTLGAYTFGVSDVKSQFIENKRYRMRDIGKLEDRIKNLEYFTSLSLLEQDTANMNIIDTVTGLNRYKCGFIVDNFTGHNVGDVTNSDYNCAIEADKGILRPSYKSSALDFILDPNSPSDNYELSSLKSGNKLLTCKYTDAEFISQPFASRVENVNPYAVYSWQGIMKLDPESDYWKDTNRLPDLLVTDNTAYDNFAKSGEVIGTMWNEWQTDWVGEPVNFTYTALGEDNGRVGAQTVTISSQKTQQTRTGVRLTSVPQVVRTVINNNTVNVSFVPYIRQRWIKFTAKKLKPNTQFYPFFDGNSVAAYCKPDTTPIVGLDPTNQNTVNQTETLTSEQRALISNGTGSLTGWFQIPPSSALPIRTGKKIFRLVDTVDNTSLSTSYAEAQYAATGILETEQTSIVSVVEPRIVREQISESVISESSSRTVGAVNWVDPLAESILISGYNPGVFATKLDLYFFTKDDNIPVMIQLREMQNGMPTQKVVPFSEVVVNAADVQTSDDGNTATTFNFESPVYLKNNTEYAIVVISDSNAYQVFTSRLGDKMINSNRIVSQQPYAGSLFKSQNASTWSPEQMEDLKFKLYRAKFVTNSNATAVFENDVVPDVYLSVLPFATTNASSVIRVFLKNHGNVVGSKVKIGIPVAQTTANSGAGTSYNGISSNSIVDKTFVSDGYAWCRSVDQTQDYYTVTSFTLDSFTIDIAELSPSALANATGRVGPASVRVSQNYNYDVFYPLFQTLEFSDTQIAWSIRTESGQSVDGNQTAGNKDSAFSAISVNQNIAFVSPRRVCSATNETPTTVGATAYQKKSVVVKAVLSTTVDHISPVIDTGRMGMFLVSNRCDAPNVFNRTDFIDETEARGCSAVARYITRKVTLENPANSLRIYLTGMIPNVANVDVYYKALTPYDPTKFEELGYVKMSALSGSNTASAQNTSDFKEYTWEVNDVPDYVSFAIKIVMKTTDTTQVPLLKELRGIALGS